MWAGGVSCKPGELASDAWIGLSRKTKYGSAIKNPGLSCPVLSYPGEREEGFEALQTRGKCLPQHTQQQR